MRQTARKKERKQERKEGRKKTTVQLCKDGIDKEKQPIKNV